MIPFVYSAGLPPNTLSTTTITLAANGGTVAIPLPCADAVVAQSITVQTTDASLAHTIEIIFAVDLPGMARTGDFQSFTYTGTGSLVRTPPLARPVNLPPGMNWLIARNAGVNPSTLAAITSGTLGGNLGALATIATSLSAGLNGVVWTPTATIPLIRVSGSMHGLLPGTTL